MRRTLPLVLGIALALGLSATPASAHASFQQGSVPADTDAEISMSVLTEETKAHTAEVVVELPEGFEIVSCSVKPGWSCTAVPAAQATGADPAPEPAHDNKDGHHAQSADGHGDDGDKKDGDKKDVRAATTMVTTRTPTRAMATPRTTTARKPARSPS